MKKEGYPESTILATGKRLRNLERHCDLNDPEAVKTYIANLTCSNGFKESLVEAYDLMIRAYSGKWNKPFYDRYDKSPKIPTEERVNILVSSASKRLSLILAMLRDSGMRPIEITWSKMRDIDLEHIIVNITSAKHCVGRTLRLKSQASMLPKAYILRKNSESTMPFSRFSRASFQKRAGVRNRLAEKIGDASLMSIRLYDFRHFKASINIAYVIEGNSQDSYPLSVRFFYGRLRFVPTEICAYSC